jgi:hypothetical protein
MPTRQLCFSISGWVSVLTVVALSASPAWAQRTSFPDIDPPKTIVVSPAIATDPLLQYPLLPMWEERVPGNAVVEYGKVKAEQSNLFGRREIWEQIGQLTNSEDASLEEVAEAVSEGELRFVVRPTSVFRYLRRGAQCQSVDWQLGGRNEARFYDILIPEVQEQRTFARYLAVRTRGQVATGDLDGALETLRYSFAHGRSLEKTRIVIGTLVGLAITNIHLHTLEELIQQPGAPSLLDSLNALPRPLISPREGILFELGSSNPPVSAYRDFDVEIDDEDFWMERFRLLVSQLPDENWNQSAVDHSDVARLAMAAYGPAKEALIAAGRSPEEVDAYSVGRAIMMAVALEHRRNRDRCLVIASQPLHLAIRLARDLEEELASQRTTPLGSVGTTPIYGWLDGYLEAHARTQRHFAALRVIEAARRYAASNDGMLPPDFSALGELTDLTDPSTGKPFVLAQRGLSQSFQLQSPAVGGLALNWIVRLRAATDE